MTSATNSKRNVWKLRSLLFTLYYKNHKLIYPAAKQFIYIKKSTPKIAAWKNSRCKLSHDFQDKKVNGTAPSLNVDALYRCYHAQCNGIIMYNDEAQTPDAIIVPCNMRDVRTYTPSTPLRMTGIGLPILPHTYEAVKVNPVYLSAWLFLPDCMSVSIHFPQII